MSNEDNMNNEENNNIEEKNINMTADENQADNFVKADQTESVASTDENKKSYVPYIIIGVCAVAALAVGLLAGKKITKNKQLAAAKEYIEWESQHHTWVEATCEAPKTCSVCGATEGEALGHEWMNATLDAPKTCKNCGATEGSPLELKQMDFSFASFSQFTGEYRDRDGNEVTQEDYDQLYIKVIVDNELGEEFWTKDSEASVGSSHEYVDYIISDDRIARYNFNCVKKLVYTAADDVNSVAYDTNTTLEILDYEGNSIKSVEINNEKSDEYIAPTGTCGVFMLDETPYIYTGVIYFEANSGNVLIDVFDTDLNRINTESSKDYISFDTFRKEQSGQYITYKNVNIANTQVAGKYIIFYYSDLDDDDTDPKKNTVILDFEKKQWVEDGSRKEVWKEIEEIEKTEDAKSDVPFDSSGYYYVNYNSAIDGYIVGTQDKEKWGYLDKNGNEIAMYADATDFSDSGYAFVSDDRKTYDLIDKDFNVIAENAISGTSVGYYYNLDLFIASQEDGSSTYYRVITSE